MAFLYIDGDPASGHWTEHKVNRKLEFFIRNQNSKSSGTRIKTCPGSAIVG